MACFYRVVCFFFALHLFGSSYAETLVRSNTDGAACLAQGYKNKGIVNWQGEGGPYSTVAASYPARCYDGGSFTGVDSTTYPDFFHVTVQCTRVGTYSLSANVDCYDSCPAGQTSDANGTCAVPPSTCSPAGTPYIPPLFTSNQFSMGPAPGGVACVAGCSVQVGGTVSVCTLDNSCYGSWTSTGAQCTSSPAAPPGIQCPPGQTAGTFNNAPICLPSAPPTSAKTSGTKMTTTVNPDGSTTTTAATTTTTCAGAGSCSSSTTTVINTYPPGVTPGPGVTPATTASKTENTDQEQKSFCAENPDAVVCKSLESTFGASCASLPACTGDAVQCATAQASWQTNCALHPDASPLSDLGNKVGSGVEDLGGTQLSGAAARTEINLPGSLNATKTFASGCIADKTFTLWHGTAFTLPFSMLCPYLSFMGSIVLAFAYLSASRIVGAV